MTPYDLKEIFKDQLGQYQELHFCLVDENGKQDAYTHRVDDLESLVTRLNEYIQIRNQDGYDIRTNLQTRPRFKRRTS